MMLSRLGNSGSFRFIAILFLLSAYSTGPIIAAEVTPERNGDRLIVHLRGQISNGDADKIRHAVLSSGLLTYDDSTDHILNLDSLGGSFLEGLKIADTLKELYVGSYVDAGSTCISACALAFMGGTNANSHDFWQDRTIYPQATLGFHAPILNIPDKGTVPVSQANKAYLVALQTAAGIVERMDQLSFKRSLLLEVLKTPGNEMRIVSTIDDVARWQIDLDTSYDHGTPHKSEINAVCNVADMWQRDFSAVGADEPTVFGNDGKAEFEESVSVKKYEGQTVFSLAINEVAGETCHIIHDTRYGNVSYKYFSTLAGDAAAHELITDDYGEFVGLSPYNFLPPQTAITNLPPNDKTRLERDVF